MSEKRRTCLRRDTVKFRRGDRMNRSSQSAHYTPRWFLYRRTRIFSPYKFTCTTTRHRSARPDSGRLSLAWHGLAWCLGRRATSPRPENSRYELDHKSGRVSPRRDSREGISSGGALVSVTLVSTPGVQLTYERRDSAMTYGVVHTRDALRIRAIHAVD